MADTDDAYAKALDRMSLKRRDVRFFSADTGERLTDQQFRAEPVQKPSDSLDNFLLPEVSGDDNRN